MAVNQLNIVKSGSNGWIEDNSAIISVEPNDIAIGNRNLRVTGNGGPNDGISIEHASQAVLNVKAVSPQIQLDDYTNRLFTVSKDGAGQGSILLQDGGVSRVKLSSNPSTDSFINAGNFGIGTSNPAEMLHISGSSNNYAKIETSNGSNSAGVRLKNPDREYTLAAVGAAGDRFIISDDTAGEDRFVIGTDGNIGLGTTNPQHSLHVDGDAYIAGDLIVTGATTTIATVTLTVDDKNIELGSVDAPTDTTADGGGITLKGDSDKTILWENDTASWDSSENLTTADGKYVMTDKVRARDGDGLYIVDDGDNGIFVKDGGKVGIGSTAPTYNLDITGTSSSWIGLRQQHGSFSLGNSDINTDGNKNYSIYDLENAAHRLVINHEGHVGIGTTSPNLSAMSRDKVLTIFGGTSEADNAGLEIAGSTTSATTLLGGIAFVNDDSTDSDKRVAQIHVRTSPDDKDEGVIHFATHDGVALTERVIIDQDGNVGLGAASPNGKLHLKGANTADSRITLEQTTVSLTSTLQQGSLGLALQALGASNPIMLATEGVTRMVISGAAGNVGIGTTTPDENLEISGRFHIGRATAPSTTTDKLYNVGGSLYWNGTDILSAGDELSELGDTTITSPVDGHVLIYNDTSDKWVNTTLTDGANITITEGVGTISIASTNTNQLTTFGIGVDTDTTPTTIVHGETLTIAGGTNVATETTSDGTVTITATDTNTNQLTTWNLDSDDSASTAIGQGETVDIAGGTNCTTTRSSNVITINAATQTSNYSQGYTTNQDFGTSNNVQFASLGVGIAPSGSIVGSIIATNDVVSFVSSDERLKDNISTIPNPISKISQIRGVEFDWNEEAYSHLYGHDVGVLAQDVKKVMPEVVATRDDGYMAVRYEKMVPLLIEGIKSQQAQIKELQDRLDEAGL
jgi:hypothetical protein